MISYYAYIHGEDSYCTPTFINFLLLKAPLSLLPLRCWYEGRSSFELCKPVSASGDRLLGTLTIVLLLSFTLIAVVATHTERFLFRVSSS